MTKDIPSRLCRTRGTTGQNKLIPQDIKKLLPKVRAVIKGTSLETFPKVTIMQRIMKLHFHFDLKKSKSGIPIAVATAIEPKNMKRLVSYTTPPEGLLLGDMFEAMYIHLLFGIKERSLGVIEASFISTFEETIRILLANWQLLVDDLANGTISETLQLDNNTRRALTAALGMGDPERAREVEREVKKGPIGIVKRIWPSIGYIGCIDNIGRKLYLETTVAKGVTIYSYGYGSSEGAQGVNLWPNDTEVSFLPYHEVAVFEFIPENEMDVESPETVFLHELEVGKIYEIVVTQACGFYRYRMGDVVQVVGYFGECPRVKFLYRRAILLTINNEKVSQAVVSAALKEAMGNWPNVSLEHFCVAESPLSPRLVDEKHTGYKHFYTFFLDIRSQSDELQLQDAIDIKVLPKLIDDGISSRHKRFESELRSKRLDPSKVFLVNSKAFWNLRQYILRIGQISAVQVKLPEKLRTPQMVDIMMSHVM
ncbi:uncharacterized protein [Apostichopus japonicus]|uniref:uncharacterized protein n=1 Tax=Stichopus japonicus TaxID=307972 RepID=UPI003AB836D3